jgi:hypothetical protein
MATGELDKRMIQRAIRKKLPRLQHCYQRRLLANPELAGEVETQLVISGLGHVVSAAASGVDDELANCVAEVMETVQIPATKGGDKQLVNVRYPFTFRPADGESPDEAP